MSTYKSTSHRENLRCRHKILLRCEPIVFPHIRCYFGYKQLIILLIWGKMFYINYRKNVFWWFFHRNKYNVLLWRNLYCITPPLPIEAFVYCVGKIRLSIPSTDVTLMRAFCITFLYVIDTLHQLLLYMAGVL